MGQIFWVDNTAGDDVYMGTDPDYPVATIDQGVDNINTYGNPGDIVRICYTGQDYEYESPSFFIKTGISWNEGEYYTVEGYDRNGGYNRPTLKGPVTPSTGWVMGFSTVANFWLVKDLWFSNAHGQNTSWSSYFIYTPSNLTDDLHYFRVRSCRFDGSFGLAGTDNLQCIYLGAGSYTHFDIRYCFFNDVGIPIRIYHNPAPRARGVVLKHNIFYSPYRQLTNYWYSTSLNKKVDFTFSHNTFYSDAASQYSGNLIYWQGGDVTSTDEITWEIRNNFVFWINTAFRKANVSGANGALIPYVGYNTHGRHNSALHAYHGADFDVFETEGGGNAVGDINIHLGYSKDDYTNFFVAARDMTYRWPETGWMLVPDVRPKSWEMTGTFEDPINGLRGAIQYSGDYKDTSIHTLHECVLEPPYKANTIVETLGIGASEVPNIMDIYAPTGINFDYLVGTGTGNILQLSDFCNYGGNSNCSATYHGVSVKPSSVVITTSVKAATVDRRGTEDTNVYARTQVRYTGLSDDTSPWSDFLKGQRNNSTTKPLATGSYAFDVRFWTAHDDATSAWVNVYNYVVP